MLDKQLSWFCTQLAKAKAIEFSKYGKEFLLGLIDPIGCHGCIYISDCGNFGVWMDLIFV
ncbi:hypothetical protein D3C76_827220 [compost metagenome]